MFRGINAINLDAKGRMAVPSRYRDAIIQGAHSKLVVTIDTDSACLLMYPINEWEKIETKIQALPSFQPATRRIQRLLIGHASEVELDKAGRFLIPALLRDYAVIEKKLMLVGQGNKFEIWSEDNWQQGRELWLNQARADNDDMPAELMDISI